MNREAKKPPVSGRPRSVSAARRAKVPRAGRASSAAGGNSPADVRLMARVAERCGAAIRQACEASSVPPEFLAALVANESGGDAQAARFEPAVYRHLQAVAAGFTPAYAGMDAGELWDEVAEMLHPKADAYHARALRAVENASGANPIQSLGDEAIAELATSWGYTQIMGYHMVGRGGTPRDLLDPDRHFRVALELVAAFAEEYQLDVQSEFAEMFRCWNTGQPYGRTTDANYVANGLCRMEIYGALAGAPPGGAGQEASSPAEAPSGGPVAG